MSKKHIRRPQKYVKPKDPTFKEWWAAQSEKKQKMYKIIAAAVAAVLLLWFVYAAFIHDDGSLKISNGAAVGAEENWLILEKDKKYYHIADVDTPEGYYVSDEDVAGTSVTEQAKPDTSFVFKPEDETNPIEYIYVKGIARSAEGMIENVYETFVGLASEGSITEVTDFDTVCGKAKTFTYAYGYEDQDNPGNMLYNQCKVTYLPAQDQDHCVLISVFHQPETADYLTEEELTAAMQLALNNIEMVEK